MAEETKQKTAEKPAEDFTQHMKAAGKATVHQFKSLLPPDFWSYGREAQREFLLAMRSAVDVMIGALESKEGTPAAKSSGKRGGTRKVKVEVE